MVGMREGFCKFMEESLGTSVSMWLEYAPYFIVWIMLCSQGSSNLRRMMCIIIDNSYTVKSSLVFKTTVCSTERKNSFLIISIGI